MTPAEVTERIGEAHIANGVHAEHCEMPFRSIGALLRRRAARQPEKTFLVFYNEAGERSELSYKAFADAVFQTARFLQANGIRNGDKVATVAFNHTDTVVQYFAALLIGAVVVPINVGEDDKRIGYILKNSRSKLAFVRTEFLERIRGILAPTKDDLLIIPVGEDSAPDYLAQIDAYPSEIVLPVEPKLDDEALIVYTSGTTGNPKGVVLTHRNLLVDAKEISAWHGLEPDRRMMCVLPIHHVNGTVVTLLTPLYCGGSVVLNQKFHTNSFFERIAAERVNVVSVVPTLLQFLLHENPDLGKFNLDCLRHIICGAGPLTVELAENFEKRFGIRILHGYGLSETTCYSCFLPVDLSPKEHTNWLRMLGFPSIGVPLHSNEMAIHDAQGNDLPENIRGEIVIRGHNVMKEYYENPEANESAFTHGWFRSGDEGFYTSDVNGRRFFFITGRIKELIIRGGTNISPFEIDEVLMNMPGVKAGLAVGFENEWYGDEIGAYVQLKDEHAGITQADVIAYCRNFFSFQKCPKVVLFGSEIPVTSTGKYQRNKLRPLFADWKSTQFKDELTFPGKT